MRTLILVLFPLFQAISLSAQDDHPPVLVSVQGKLQYISPDNKKPANVRAGAVLKPAGNIKLLKGAKAILYCNGQFVAVKTPGKHLLSKTCASADAQSLGFEYDFGNYVLAAVELAAYAHSKGYGWIKSVTDSKTGGDGWSSNVTDPKTGGSGSSGWGSNVTEPKTGGSGSSGWGNNVTDPKTGGSGSSGWGNNVTDPKTGGSGSSGWGQLSNSMIPILPFGRVTATPITFFWSNPSGAKSFHFEIQDELNLTVYSTDLRDSFLQVDLSTLKLTPGIKYLWKVSVPDNNKLRAAKLNFEIATPEKRTAVLKKVNEMPMLQSEGDVSLRRLAEAVALERDGWYYAAYETYLQVQQTNPNNLTRMMASAFWMRYGLTPLAENAAMK